MAAVKKGIIAAVRIRPLESLLVVAIFALVGQLGWPAVAYWWRLPRPGRLGTDAFQADSLASEFLIYLPLEYRHKRHWPLVIFLHGSGERGNDLSLLRGEELFSRKLPSMVVAPQCLRSRHWEPKAIGELVKHISSRYRVDSKRVYLVGFSMGAYGAWQAAATSPELFAAIVPIAGGGDPADAKVLSAVSVWAFHGAKDDAVPATSSERIIEALQANSGDAKLTILPDAGHGICRTICQRDDLWKWLFEQSR